MPHLSHSHQHTLAHAVSCSGVALHSGKMVDMVLKPAPVNTGVVFKRRDVQDAIAYVPARYDAVCDTTLGTTIRNSFGIKISTIEHLMAAFWGAGVDNVLVELDGPEIPIMDGSSEPFVFLIECAGLETQDAPRSHIEILREVSVREGDSFAAVVPADAFALDIKIEFKHPSIEQQRAMYDFSKTTFKQALCRARTFGFASDVEKLRSMGLARGGSLRNAIVLNDTQVLNEEGLRYNDEFVRHKALDCAGDYFLSGGFLKGAVTTFRPGHGINNKLLHAIFADERNYRLVGEATLPQMVPMVETQRAAASA